MSARWKQRPEGGGRFAIWLIIGLMVYFLYSFKHSKLHQDEAVMET